MAEQPQDQNQDPASAQSGFRNIVVAGLLVVFLIGILAYPWWWRTALFGTAFRRRRYWYEGLGAVWDHLWLPITVLVAIGLVLSAGRKSKPISWIGDRILAAARWLALRASNRVVAVLFICAWAGTLHVRTPSSLDWIERPTSAELDSLLSSFRSGPAERDRPLETPRLFAYLSKIDVEALYGMYEPDLVPSSVIEELQDGTTLKGGISIDQYLNTEAGREQYRKRLTEYRQAPKTPERKLRDVVQYLADQQDLRRLSNLRGESREVKALDDATALLVSYDITISGDRLRAIRDRLLEKELAKFHEELQKVEGLVLIEGDWIVQEVDNHYVLTRQLVENVSRPPVCQVRVPKLEISEAYRTIFSETPTAPKRLAIVGSVISAVSGQDRTLRLKPVAIY